MKKYAGFFLLFPSLLFAHSVDFSSAQPEVVISDLDKLQAAGATILSKDPENNLGVAHATPEQMEKISRLNHFQGKCAGFEVLNTEEAARSGMVLSNLVSYSKQVRMSSGIQLPIAIQFNQSYKDLSDQADPVMLKANIDWLSSYPNRYNKSANPNIHVEDLKTKLTDYLKTTSVNFEVRTVDHTSTKQKSLKITLPGKTRPDEIVVLGAHLDSINQSYFGSTAAPGADDNASGSSNIIEALKILAKNGQPDRTLEFFWYAGEESGLLGSAEIAKDYKAKKKIVIAVLQLDMTLFPGSGEQVIGLVSDFTSPWLNDVMSKIYSTYFNANFIVDTCGYGCSDHASWHRQGFPAATPFESTTSTMNKLIHTENDKFNAQSSITHSNTFTKIAVLFGLTLGNSELRDRSY